MSALREQIDTAIHWAERCKAILGKDMITPEERIELETLCAIAIELIKSASPSKLREAGRIVELRYRLKEIPFRGVMVDMLNAPPDRAAGLDNDTHRYW